MHQYHRLPVVTYYQIALDKKYIFSFVKTQSSSMINKKIATDFDTNFFKTLRIVSWKLGIISDVLFYIAGRNAIVVVTASCMAALLISKDIDVFSQTSHVRPGLPSFSLPKFSVHSGNVSLSTADVFQVSTYIEKQRAEMDGEK